MDTNTKNNEPDTKKLIDALQRQMDLTHDDASAIALCLASHAHEKPIEWAIRAILAD